MMRLSVPAIRKVVENFYGISEGDMRGPRRSRALARPRQIAMFLARELTPASLPRIGMHYDRDHTTVLHACRVVAKRLTEDSDLRDDLCHFRAVLTGAPLVIVSHPKYGESSVTNVVIHAEPPMLKPYCGYGPGELTDSTLADSISADSPLAETLPPDGKN
jgi:hypothetical protein